MLSLAKKGLWKGNARRSPLHLSTFEHLAYRRNIRTVYRTNFSRPGEGAGREGATRLERRHRSLPAPDLPSGARHASSTTSMSCVAYSTPLWLPVGPASLGRQAVDNHGGRRREAFGPLTRQTSPSPTWPDGNLTAGFGRRWQPATVSRRRMQSRRKAFPPERSRRGPQHAGPAGPLPSFGASATPAFTTSPSPVAL
jgi:hypothetical protein